MEKFEVILFLFVMKANKNREEYCQKACVEWEANKCNLKPRNEILNLRIHSYSRISFKLLSKIEIQFYPK